METVQEPRYAGHAIGGALWGRPQFASDPELKGAGLAGVAFIVGAVVIGLSLVRFVMPWLFVLFA